MRPRVAEGIGAVLREGTIVHAVIEAVLPVGLVCRVLQAPGTRGLIKYWEWSWDERLTEDQAQRQTRQLVGREVACCVVGRDDEKSQILLSPRQARRDEWEAAVGELVVGETLVSGEVVRLVGTDEYDVRLDLGVMGRTYARDLPPFPGQMAPRLFLGDRVCGVVRDLDLRGCRITLDLDRALRAKRARLLQADAASPLVSSLGDLATFSGSLSASPERRRAEAEEELLRRHPVVVERLGWIEDDPESTEDMRALLAESGTETVLLSCSREALLSELRRQPVQLCVVDIDLGRGRSGIELAKATIEKDLLERGQILFLTGVGSSRLLEQARALDPLDVLAKDRDLGSLRRYVRAMEPVRPRFAAVVERAAAEEESGDEPASQTGDDPGRYLRRLLAGLTSLARRAGADRACLVRLNHSSGQIEVVCDWPAGSTARDDQLLANLVHSPLGDVLKGSPTYHDPDCGQHRRRYVHMEPVWGDLGSIRVQPVWPFGDRTHATVLLARGAGRFDDPLLPAEYASHLATTLESAALAETGRALAAAAATGMLALGIVHDLRNRFMPVTASLARMQRTALQLVRAEGGATPAEVEQQLEGMARTEGKLRELLDPLNRLLEDARRQPPRDRDPVACVRRAAENVGSLRETREGRVAIEVGHAEVPGELRGPPLVLEQILFNLLLNAVQQIGLSGDPSGTVQVAMDTSGAGLTIRITDSGPGIHRRDFDRISEYGFTTRPAREGTGIGLFHVRQLCRRLGATVRVAESTLFFGTTFEVRVPCVAPEGG